MMAQLGLATSELPLHLYMVHGWRPTSCAQASSGRALLHEDVEFFIRWFRRQAIRPFYTAAESKAQKRERGEARRAAERSAAGAAGGTGGGGGVGVASGAPTQQNLRPVEEWASLPPAPDGHLPRRSAKDDDLDMFGELPSQGQADVPEPSAAEQGAAGASTSGVEGAAPAVAAPMTAAGPAGEDEGERPRPRWGPGAGPLFSNVICSGVVGDAGAVPAPELEEVELFEDAKCRLASMGFDLTKCHLALEAAGGDEAMARAFLIREA
mmetsp:Transcript_155581/g.497449  ORF Transcript_155581/g.497449 Transcript_155581/m.497449 type:complete len:267 (-) Transcript_155581:72-872(-)